MVYDEGFNVEFGELSFFTFMKYSRQSNENGLSVYFSKCYSTLVGWYSNREKNKWGCFQATKVGTDPEQVTYISKGDNISVVEPTNSQVRIYS